MTNSILITSISIIIGFISSLFLLGIALKYRSKDTLGTSIDFKNSMKLSLKPTIIFIAIFDTATLLGKSLSRIMGIAAIDSLTTFISFFVALFTMQTFLRKKLIQEGLDEEKSKKLSGSAVSYFFWGSLLLGTLYIALLTIIIIYYR